MAANDPEQPVSLKDLLIFHTVARALTSSLDLESILRAILQQMEHFFQPESWSLLMVDEKRNDLYYAVAMGHAEAELRDLRVPMGEGGAGWVALHGEILVVPEVGLDSRFDPLSKHHSAIGVQSAICIPLRSRRRTLGVIELFNCRIENLTDYTISFLHVLCDFAAIAIENARSVERIQELTITDDCTGLYNVRHLYDRLEAEVERMRRSQTPFSVIFIDLDYFKCINDEFGHLTGSLLLASFGQALKSLVRRVDSTFRYGGDEFTVLLPETDKDEAQETAHRLHSELRTMKFDVAGGRKLPARASFGVSTCPDDGASVQEIIRAADEMMYLVKRASRDNVAVAGRGITGSA